jgi:rhodanese-related sulfurtransferase
MPMKIGYQQLIDDAMAEITTLSPEQARKLLGNEDTVFVDIRDVRELQREGKVPGAFHATRDMLEFWIDPDSPYHKPVFAEPKQFVFYCQSGWRSALATQAVARMGMERVCHIGGGFHAWKESGGEVEEVARKT